MPKTPASGNRLLPLDVLRGIAILLVVGYHVRIGSTTNLILKGLRCGGWVGVDLFFVLSGFLVSGLLFREYQKQGDISVRNFLIRRGLKIYPAFYFFLYSTTAVMLLLRHPPRLHYVLAESIFLQNYVGRVWRHTWSLAVEEHFYFGITLLVACLLRFRKTESLRILPRIMIILGIGLLAARVANIGAGCDKNYFPTHLRMDSLGFGVFLSYYWHFDRQRVQDVFSRFRLFAIAAGLGLLAPAFLWALPESPFVYTVGFTGFYIGSGLILMSLLNGPFPNNLLTRAIARIGTYSYSIYLWHVPVVDYLVSPTVHSLGIHGRFVAIGVAVAESVFAGILAARLVEVPVLKLRDKFFPSRIADAASAMPDIPLTLAIN